MIYRTRNASALWEALVQACKKTPSHNTKSLVCSFIWDRDRLKTASQTKGTIMSEKENAKLIENVYEKLKAGDVESVLHLCAVDIEWELPEMDNVPFAGVWRGPDGVRDFFAKVFQSQNVIEFEPQQYFAQDNRVVVLGTLTMRLNSTGREFRSPCAHVWTIRHGGIARFYEYVDTALVTKAHTNAMASATVR